MAYLMVNIREKSVEWLVEIQLNKEAGNEWRLQCSHLEAQDCKLTQDMMGHMRQMSDHLLEVQVSPSSIFGNHHPPSSWFVIGTSSSCRDMNSQGFPSRSINVKRFQLGTTSDE